MKHLASAFSFIFSDNEWFNKILVGGFYFLLIPFGIGLVMINGFLLSFHSVLQNNEKTLPYWRNYRTIFKEGFRTGSISYVILVIIIVTLSVNGFTYSIPKLIALLSLSLTLNSILISRSLKLFALSVSSIILVLAISFGWMFIVVGWPLLIFLALLVQIFLLSKT